MKQFHQLVDKLLLIMDMKNRNDVQRAPTIISDYEASDIHEQHEDVFPSASHRTPPPPPPPPPAFALPYLKGQQQLPHHQMFQEESQPFVIFYFKIYICSFFFCRYVPKRSLPLSNFRYATWCFTCCFYRLYGTCSSYKR